MNVIERLIFSCAVATFLCVNMPAQVGVLPQKDVTLKQTTDEKFRIGDVWEYQTRKGEERSKITILRIDESPELGIIVHVRVDNVRLSNCHGGPEPDSVPHMPRKALDASVKKNVSSKQAVPAYEEGYQEWREAYTQKHAGVYVVVVRDAISVAEKTFRKGIGCE